MIRKMWDLSLVTILLMTAGAALGQDPSSSLPSAPQPIPQTAPSGQIPGTFPALSAPTLGFNSALSGQSATSQPYSSSPQGQVPPPPPVPPNVPFQQGAPVPAPYVPYQPGPSMPPPYNPYQDRNGWMLRGDPLLEGPVSSQPGLYFGLELDLLGPHISNGLNANVRATGFEPNLVALGGAPLDWTGSPRFNLGYRFGEGLGAFELTYRFLVTEGDELLLGWDLDGSDAPLKSRLNMNVVDLDYVSREIRLGGLCEMKWRAGARLASIFFDSQAEGFFLQQEASNYFFGAGPHFGLDFRRRLGNTDLGLFGIIDTSVPIGQIHQSFSEVFVASDGTIIGGATDVRQTQAVPTLGIQFGLSWTPNWRMCNSRYSIGYAFEEWWNVGEAGNSHADLTTQGIFFRGEFNF